MSYCTKPGIIKKKKFFYKKILYLDNGKDKVMFLTKDDLSSPSTIKLKDDEGFDPWEQHGLSFFIFKINLIFILFLLRFNFTKWFN